MTHTPDPVEPSSRPSGEPPAHVSAHGLTTALGGLVEAGTLDDLQARAVLLAVGLDRSAALSSSADAEARTARPARTSWPLVLAEIGGYVGGLFVLAAVLVVLARHGQISTKVCASDC